MATLVVPHSSLEALSQRSPTCRSAGDGGRRKLPRKSYGRHCAGLVDVGDTSGCHSFLEAVSIFPPTQVLLLIAPPRSRCACSLFPGVGSGARPIAVVDFHCESHGCPPFGVSAPSALFLLVVPSNIMPGWCFHSATIPLVRFPPLARRWMVVRGSSDVLSKVAPSASKGRSLFSVSLGLRPSRHL